jgi:hypothetical protein
MAVTRIGAGAGAMTTGTAATFNGPNITTSDATTVAVVGVVISVSTNDSNTTCSVTYGGTTMTQLNLTLVGTSTNRNAVGIYYLANPGTGTQSVVVTPGGTSTKAGLIAQAVAFSSVDSVGTAQTGTATTHAITSASGGYALRVIGNGAALTSPDQTNEYLNGQTVGGSGDYGLIQSATGASSVSFNVTGTATQANSVGTSLAAVTAPLPTTGFIYDSFTGTDGTALESHTGETGATWTKMTGATGAYTIASNRIYNSSTTANYYASGTPPSADYEVSAKVRTVSNTGNLSIKGRYSTSADSGYDLLIGGLLQLRKLTAGSAGSLGTGSITTTAGQDHTIALRMVGDQISAYYDGVLSIGPITDATYTTAGTAGVRGASSATSSTGYHITELAAVNLAVTAVTPQPVNINQALKRASIR